MTPYITIEDLTGEIPDAVLTSALDDNNDGLRDEGAWEAVASKASSDVDALLAARYAVPFAGPIPALVKRAARVFALEMLYLKRGLSGEHNPWQRPASELRKLLTDIAGGVGSLDVQTPRARPSASIITEPAKTFSSRGNLAT